MTIVLDRFFCRKALEDTRVCGCIHIQNVSCRLHKNKNTPILKVMTRNRYSNKIIKRLPLMGLPRNKSPLPREGLIVSWRDSKNGTQKDLNKGGKMDQNIE